MRFSIKEGGTYEITSEVIHHGHNRHHADPRPGPGENEDLERTQKDKIALK